MQSSEAFSNRRWFLKAATSITGTAVSGLSLDVPARGASAEDLNIVGPKEGYSPQIGTLVSEMTWMRTAMLHSVQGMKQADLDFLLDDKANRIGALLLHLAATDALYHIHTFEGEPWGSWDSKVKQQWETAMTLSVPARETIKGHDLDYYLSRLSETRESTLSEFRKRDDKWLMTVDTHWPWGPTNNYCKWFHVCEHESNHNGQIKFLKSRLPGAKAENG